MKRLIITVLVIAILGAGGFFGYRQYQASQAAKQANYQTTKIERGELTAIVGATGSVRSNQTTIISWQTSGRIGELMAKVDDKVKAGQTLAKLDEKSLSQALILARSDLVSAKRNLENLVNSDVTRTQAQLAVVNAQKALDDAQEKRDAKNFQRASDATLDGAKSDYDVTVSNVKKAEDFYNYFNKRAEDDPDRVAAYSRLVTARQQRDRALANLNYLLSSPDQQELNEADAQLGVAKAKLKEAQREWERLKNGPDPQDIKAAQARIDSIEATLNLVDIEAPINGTITESRSKLGDQVSVGTVSFRIDDLSRLLVDVLVPEVDINRIIVGQSTKLTFDAILNKEYNGKVFEVARVGSNVQGVVNFTVTIEISNNNNEVRPGMTAAVNIVVNQLKDVLLVPNRAVRLRDGKRIIYILKNEKIAQPVEIQLGATSDLTSELIAGEVSEGDLVILNPPTQFESSGGFFNFGNR